jgi:catechol 2,3-dioxygenase-like lactoylglutathione lyase family enzyme
MAAADAPGAQSMFSHVMVGTNDVERARVFYDALFAAAGAKPGRADDKGRLIWMKDGALFMVSPPLDGGAACHANGGTIGFTLSSPEQVEAWHAAGVSHGGQTCEEPPGPRSMPLGQLYLAYLRDPDGNKLCGVHRMPA